MPEIVDRWNTAYFDRRLSPGVLAELRALTDSSPDAQALADRAFRLMRAARQDPADFSRLTAWMIGFSVPRTVPSAWSGAVPPVTLPGRHRKLDEYIAHNPWHQPEGEGVFVDLGCGFPPFTTMDTAKRLSDWRVIGVDPTFGRYLVYDADGAYACFDEEHRLRYYQAGNYDPDTAGSRARFHSVLERLLPKLPDGDCAEEVADEHGRLIRNPLHRYVSGNLDLMPGGIGEFTLESGADVIRCMNVFMYFDHPFRLAALDWAAGVLRPGGLFLCGSNWSDSACSRYTVYRKEADRLVPREFAFSPENVRPIELAPWYALHDDNLENLANAYAVATIRSDERFRRRVDARLDALLTQLGVCVRGPDGNLGGVPEDVPADELALCSSTLASRLDEEGLVDEAVEVLRRAGHDAWRNPVGHIAMHPATPPPLAPSAVL